MLKLWPAQAKKGSFSTFCLTAPLPTRKRENDLGERVARDSAQFQVKLRPCSRKGCEEDLKREYAKLQYTAKTPSHLPMFLEEHHKITSILEIEDGISTEAPVWELRRTLDGLDTKLWTLKGWHRKFVTHTTN